MGERKGEREAREKRIRVGFITLQVNPSSIILHRNVTLCVEDSFLNVHSLLGSWKQSEKGSPTKLKLFSSLFLDVRGRAGSTLVQVAGHWLEGRNDQALCMSQKSLLFSLLFNFGTSKAPPLLHPTPRPSSALRASSGGAFKDFQLAERVWIIHILFSIWSRAKPPVLLRSHFLPLRSSPHRVFQGLCSHTGPHESQSNSICQTQESPHWAHLMTSYVRQAPTSQSFGFLIGKLQSKSEALRFLCVGKLFESCWKADFRPQCQDSVAIVLLQGLGLCILNRLLNHLTINLENTFWRTHLGINVHPLTYTHCMVQGQECSLMESGCC